MFAERLITTLRSERGWSIGNATARGRAVAVRPLLGGAAVLSSLLVGYLLPRLGPVLAASGLLLGVAGVMIVLHPEIGTLAAVMVLYLNLPGIAVTVHGLPRAAAGASLVLLAVPFVLQRMGTRRRLLLDRPFALMVLFLGAITISSFMARDAAKAMDWLLTYVLEGLLVYVLVLNLVRSWAMLRRVVWALIAVALLLAAMTVYQEATHTYGQQFAGLAQRNVEHGFANEDFVTGKKALRPRHKIHLAERAAGPIGDPNRYGQILLFVLPLAFFRARDEQRRRWRLLAAAASAIMLAAILLTYSRGAFVTLLALVVLLLVLRVVRAKQVVIAAVLLAAAITVVTPGFLLRMESLRGVVGLVSQQNQHQPDQVTRGRLTEMLAAWRVFCDYPIIGVGPGQFASVYSVQYMNDPDIALRQIARNRRAHTLYFELMAETGLVGFTLFMAIIAWTLVRLWQRRRTWKQRDPELANLALACWLGLLAYLGTGVFLQLSFQRYYWLQLALAGAVVHVLGRGREGGAPVANQ